MEIKDLGIGDFWFGRIDCKYINPSLNIINMSVGSRKELKESLASASIKYTKHFEKEVNPERGNINKEIIEDNLKNPEKLLKFEYQPDKHSREKYDLYFDKSNKYLLRIIISLSPDKKYLYVITSHVINRKRLELQRQRRG